MVSKTKLRSNKAQIMYLCQYMADNKDFAAGESRTWPHGVEQLEQQWHELKAALDELGPSRSVEQWKIAWRDQKRKARMEESGALNKAVKPVSNSVVQELSAHSLTVLGAIGREMVMDCEPAEPPIGVYLPAPPNAEPPIPASPVPLSPSPPPIQLSPPLVPEGNQTQPGTASRSQRRARRVRANQSLNAQLQLNGLIRELILELRQNNRLRLMELKMKQPRNRR